MIKPADREPADREQGNQQLAAGIEAAVRAVPGVTTLFRPGGVVASAIAAGAEVFAVAERETSLVRLKRLTGSLDVEVSIGVDGSVGAVEIVRRVRAAIDAAARANGETVTEIRATVVHVDS